MKKFWKITAVILVLFILAAAAFCTVFLMNSYPAGDWAEAALESDNEVTVTKTEDYILFSPGETETGFVFYPGGNVEYTAYAPLMRALAEQDVCCILVEMPLNLAVMDMYAAEDIPEQFPQIQNWYIGGHSLGGSSAAYHLEKTGDAYRGLVLLASYSTVALQDSGLSVCSLYGTEDGILNQVRYRENLANLPADFLEIILEGGNHSGFADYGLQKNDGIPTITSEEQISVTVDSLIRFFEK